MRMSKKRFTQEMLDSPERQAVEEALRGKTWKMTVIVQNRAYGFLKHDEFPENVFFHCSVFENGQIPAMGDLVEVEVAVTKHYKTGVYGYSAKQGVLHRRKSNASTRPNDFDWPQLISTLINAARGVLPMDQCAKRLNDAARNDQAMAPLLGWLPEKADLVLFKQARSATNRLATCRQADPQLLESFNKAFDQPDPVWARMKKLAGRYAALRLKEMKEGAGESDTGDMPLARISSRKMQPHASPTYSSVQIGHAVFGHAGGEYTIFIDEAWPGTVENAVLPGHCGVIAGLVAHGRPGQDVSGLLPQISTHSYKIPSIAHKALHDLLQCKEVFPFILPLSIVDINDMATYHYEELVAQSIRFLLGWLLPGHGPGAEVRIIAERFRTHPEGTDMTDFFRGLLHHPRYARWTIEEVCWEDKEYGLLPYADLLAHLTLEHTQRSVELGNAIQYKDLPGHVPFSLHLVPRLERLEHLESMRNMEDVFDFLTETRGSRFGDTIRKDLLKRIRQRPELWEPLLEALEERYQSPLRDLRSLRFLFDFAMSCVNGPPAHIHIRLSLLWSVLALQDANHDGDPDRVRAAVTYYTEVRKTALDVDRELTAYIDLNLAVHWADRFEFVQAEKIIRRWLDDPLFAALSGQQQGRMHSSMGQYASMQGRHAQAEACFCRALECFAHSGADEKERKRNCEKTAIYRAISAMDAGDDAALTRVEAALGSISGAARLLSVLQGSRSFYQHHLLLRTLHKFPDQTEAACRRYLQNRSSWFKGAPQHPWPLINMYRGLLLIDNGDEEAARQSFDRAMKGCGLSGHGATIKLIGAMIACVAWCCCGDRKYKAAAQEFMDAARRTLPGAARNLEILRRILANEPVRRHVDTALSALPFNYH